MTSSSPPSDTIAVTRWLVFPPGTWVTCLGTPNHRRRDVATHPERRCGRRLFRVGRRHAPVRARFAGTTAHPPTEPPDADLHYCRDCHSFTEVRDLT